MASKPRLDLTCFGAPRLALDGKQVEIKRRKSLALLIYLAITQRSYTREALATMFWPEAPTERAYANLRQSLWEINQVLGPGWIQAERDIVALDPSKSLKVDVIEFRQRLAKARQAEVDENQSLIMLEEAVHLYQGQFLAGYNLRDAPDFDEWVFFESESLQSKFKELLESLVKLLLESSKAVEAIPYARRRVALDQLDEAAQHQLIEAYAQSGQHNAALRQYQEYGHLLEEQLGEEPGPELQALYEQLQRAGRAETAPILKPAQGAVLKNRYHLEELLGQGSLGSVFRAHDTRLDRQVAIKLLDAPFAEKESRTRLLREARISARLNHPNIVSIYDADESQGLAFIVMEYVIGKSLRQVPPTSLEEILQIAGQVCTALSYAHSQNVIHRDLKPENIMISGGMVKLTDFGLARTVEEGPPGEVLVLVGTPVYMAPELLAGNPADQRSDLYALGVILYELITGRVPFQWTSLAEVFSKPVDYRPVPPSHFRAEISPQLEALVLRLLDKNPDRRYQTAAEVQLALSEMRKPSLTLSLPSRKRNNLPALLTRFFGRQKEIRELKSILSPSFVEDHHARLVTLVGPGGTGKTRLSIQAASELVDDFQEGVWLVELATLADPDLIYQAVAVTFGLREESGKPFLETLIDYLQPRSLLLILDNCEHLVEASAQLAETLLQRCPELHLLVSSREALGVSGERVMRVPPLSFPPPSAAYTDQADWLKFDSILLFVDRAAAARPGFTLQAANAASIAQICARLDGIPLAIELAAARVPAMTVEQILERLDDRFRLLTGGSRTALPRHQTLFALIDWSYELLSPAEQALLRRLAVFSGGWTLEAAEAVLDGWTEENWVGDTTPPASVLDGLSLLINKSLVIAETKDGEEMRYRMLETIRQYGRERLIQAGEASQIHQGHLAYFTKLGLQIEEGMSGLQASKWIKRLIVEMDNIRTALGWAIESDVVTGLMLSSSVLGYWWIHSIASEGIEWLNKLLDAPADRAPSLVRAKALNTLSNINPGLTHSQQAAEAALEMYQALKDDQGTVRALNALGIVLCLHENFYKGRACFAESLELSRQIGFRYGEAEALGYLGFSGVDKSNPILFQHYKESLAIFRELGDLANMSWILREASNLAIWNGDFDAAQAWLEELMEVLRQLDPPNLESFVLEPNGRLAYHQGDYEKARFYFQEVVSWSELRGQYFLKTWIITRLGLIALWQGKLQEARSLFLESLASFRKIGTTDGVVFNLEGLAHLAAVEGNFARAVTLIAWADATRQEIGDMRPPVEQAEVDRSLAPICCQLDEQTLEQARAKGQAMSLEEAVQFAISENN